MLIPREAKHQWETEKPYHWTEDAACAFLPPTMFAIANGGSPIADGLTEDELKDLNNANFEAATKVCNTKCPVFTECYLSAEDVDFEETVRAGIIPTKHNPRSKGRPRQVEVMVKNDPTKPCKNGHALEDWRKRKEGVDSWYCQGCKREQKGCKPAVKVNPEGPCSNGHEGMWYQDKHGYFRCRTCKRDRDRKTKAAKKAAMSDSLEA